MPYSRNDDEVIYVPPKKWSEIEYPNSGNQADWIYAISHAVAERANVPASYLSPIDWEIQSGVYDSYMLFGFAKRVENVIINALRGAKYYNENGTLNHTDPSLPTLVWLNPESPVVMCLYDTDIDPERKNLYADVKYNYLLADELLKMEGCNFREPLTCGYSSLETCFPEWCIRVMNALNKLHVSAVEVWCTNEKFYGRGTYNNSNYHGRESGTEVDNIAWQNAVTNYSKVVSLPDGDGTSQSTFWYRHWSTSNVTTVTWNDYMDYWGEGRNYHRATYVIENGSAYVRRLKDGIPNMGCGLWTGYVSTIDLLHEYEGQLPENTLMTKYIGKINANDPYRAIDGNNSWTLLLEDETKIRPTYTEPSEDSSITKYVGSHTYGLFYADWAVGDGFQFRENDN